MGRTSLQAPAARRVAPFLAQRGLDQPRSIVSCDIGLDVQLSLGPDVAGELGSDLQCGLGEDQAGSAAKPTVRGTASVAQLARAAIGPTGSRAAVDDTHIQQPAQPDTTVLLNFVLCVYGMRNNATAQQDE